MPQQGQYSLADVQHAPQAQGQFAQADIDAAAFADDLAAVRAAQALGRNPQYVSTDPNFGLEPAYASTDPNFGLNHPSGSFESDLAAVRAVNYDTLAKQFGGTNEAEFQAWYHTYADRLGLDPNPDDPQHFYDYRAAYRAGAKPDQTGHWPSEFKREGHPRLVLDGVDTRTGKAVDYDALAAQHGGSVSSSSGILSVLSTLAHIPGVTTAPQFVRDAARKASDAITAPSASGEDIVHIPVAGMMLPVRKSVLRGFLGGALEGGSEFANLLDLLSFGRRSGAVRGANALLALRGVGNVAEVANSGSVAQGARGVAETALGLIGARHHALTPAEAAAVEDVVAKIRTQATPPPATTTVAVSTPSSESSSRNSDNPNIGFPLATCRLRSIPFIIPRAEVISA